MKVLYGIGAKHGKRKNILSVKIHFNKPKKIVVVKDSDRGIFGDKWSPKFCNNWIFKCF